MKMSPSSASHFAMGRADLIVVANKTDLCSDTPPPLPDIAFGQAVPPSAEQDDTPSPPQSPRASTDTSLRPRAVAPLEGALFAKQHGLLYVETSAKEGWHVVDAFEWTAREVLATVSRTELERRKVRSTSTSGEGRADHSAQRSECYEQERTEWWMLLRSWSLTKEDPTIRTSIGQATHARDARAPWSGSQRRQEKMVPHLGSIRSSHAICLSRFRSNALFIRRHDLGSNNKLLAISLHLPFEDIQGCAPTLVQQT